jgi:phage terminase large subunit-like protein
MRVGRITAALRRLSSNVSGQKLLAHFRRARTLSQKNPITEWIYWLVLGGWGVATIGFCYALKTLQIR